MYTYLIALCVRWSAECAGVITMSSKSRFERKLATHSWPSHREAQTLYILDMIVSHLLSDRKKYEMLALYYNFFKYPITDSFK